MTTHRPRRPRFPFFKDEVGVGVIGRHVTLKASVRALIIAIMVGAVCVALVLWWGVGKVSQLDSLVQQRHDERISSTQVQQQEIADNKAIALAATAHLACEVAAAFPPGQSVLIDHLRTEYGCGPFIGSAPTPTAVPSSAPAPKVIPSSGRTSGQLSPQNLPRPTITVSATATRSVTVTARATPSPTPDSILSSLLCPLLGTLCN